MGDSGPRRLRLGEPWVCGDRGSFRETQKQG